ncbi:hypothetical protein, partial [Ochrobactrum sp. P6BS-III]|uniref:hypothetical protein n=1 Tax=Ochrobactrum sp. P6BS-III TaxID=1920636 RepID=UPI001AECE5D7
WLLSLLSQPPPEPACIQSHHRRSAIPWVEKYNVMLWLREIVYRVSKMLWPVEKQLSTDRILTVQAAL